MTEEHLAYLIDQYGDDLLRLCTLYLRNYHLAEDALQDTYIKVWKHYEEFDKRSSEKTWMTRIAINVCKNYLRGSWYHRIVPMELSDVIKGQADQYQQTEDAVDLLRAIWNLQEKYRVVILLYYYEELSVKEIAEILNCSKNTVLTRLRRGRQACRKWL